MTLADRRLSLLRRLALLCVLLMLATISLSAYMRLSASGLGCAEGPACYGQGLRALQQGALPVEQGGHAVAAARLAHRIVASLALVLVIVMVLTTLATRPPLWRAGRIALSLLGLALALAVLGIATPGARLPAVGLGNLLGGFVMLALCWRLAARGPLDAAGAVPGLGLWGVAGVALVACQIASGALVSTSYAALACSEITECGRAAQATGWDWQVLNPWREPSFAATPAPVNPAGALTQLVHRVGAIVVLPVLALLAIVGWRRGRRREGAALMALAAVQPGLGLLMVATGMPLAPALLHNLVAALLLATLVRLV